MDARVDRIQKKLFAVATQKSSPDIISQILPKIQNSDLLIHNRAVKMRNCRFNSNKNSKFKIQEAKKKNLKY